MSFSHHFISKSKTSVISYNFDRPVSRFGGGSKTDVMLLQALFRMMYYEFPEGGQFKFPPPVQSTGTIVVDGTCGPQTRIHIDTFERQVNALQNSVSSDGVIDPYPAVNAKTTKFKNKFKLDFLNSACEEAAQSAGNIDAYRRMILLDQHEDGVYPLALRAALQSPRKFP